MRTPDLRSALENFDPTGSDYDLYWQLAFATPADIEQLAQQSWQLSCDRLLPIPFVSLICRLCLETSTNPLALKTAYVFLNAHSDDEGDKLKAVTERLPHFETDTPLEE